MQAKFLKKFFSTHRTSGLKRQIYTFAAHENEKFYQCWERYLETINAFPHHGFDTWMLVNHFYEGMFPGMKQLLETVWRVFHEQESGRIHGLPKLCGRDI